MHVRDCGDVEDERISAKRFRVRDQSPIEATVSEGNRAVFRYRMSPTVGVCDAHDAKAMTRRGFGMSGVRFIAAGWIFAMVSAGLSPVANAQQDAEGAAPSFKEGDVITIDGVEALKPYLPKEFWNNRDFFFYEGMQLEIGPFQRDYSGSDAYKAATEANRGQVKIGPDGSLENYHSGRPFPL